jgi:alpha-beta hydrolase superfamily lysophospholipase
MKRFRVVFWLTGTSLAVCLLLAVALGILATEWALHPGRRALGPALQSSARSIAAANHAVLESVSIPAQDGVTLRAWSIHPTSGNHDLVILLHGHTDNRAGMLGVADLLLRHGYAVLLPDARAHGVSGGELATYGALEADDIRRWFEAEHKTRSSHCIYGLGESMGAAQLLNSLQAEPGFCAVIAESSFASFREASYDRLGEKLYASSWVGRTLLRPAVEAGLLYARWKYGVDLEQASPEKSVAASHVPVLLIHGLRDRNLPSRHSERILALSAGRIPALSLWEPAEAGHCGAWPAEPREYEHRVLDWLQIHR